MKFEVGKEYKTIKKNMEMGVRTFKVLKVIALSGDRAK